jgi:hypothetical protein
MADAIYVLEKLIQAVDALATGAGRVQERLGHAAIHLFRVYPEDISDENLRRTFIGVMDDLSYAQAQGGAAHTGHVEDHGRRGRHGHRPSHPRALSRV